MNESFTYKVEFILNRRNTYNKNCEKQKKNCEMWMERTSDDKAEAKKEQQMMFYAYNCGNCV